MKQPSGGPIRARDSEVNYYTASGILFLLGLVVFLFMIVLCFRAKQPGSSRMLLLLDGVEAVFLLYLALLYHRQRRILRKKLGYSRAAVDRRPDGSSRLEFSADAAHYCLDVPREEKIAESGMVNIWYDPDDPRNVFFGKKKPEKASPFALTNLGLLVLLCGLVNAVFYLFLF